MTQNADDRKRFAPETLLLRIAGSRARLLTISLLISGVAFAAQWLLVANQSRQLSHWLLMILGSTISGAVVGCLAGTVLWLACERQRAASRHAWEVLQLNHHIRNAMQVIAYSQNGLPREQVNNVMEALNRIGDVLRTVSGSSLKPESTPEEILRASRESTNR